MIRLILNFILLFAAAVYSTEVLAGEGNTVILSVECKNVRISGEGAKINNAFEDSHMKWVIKCPDASATKVTESATGIQWRLKPIKNDIGKVIVQYRDKFNQQYQRSMIIKLPQDTAQMAINRMFNTVKIERLAGGKTVSAVFFANTGKKDKLTDKDKCVMRGNGLYDFPTIWQGPQRTWSLYIKTSSGTQEIPASGNFFGLHGDFIYGEQNGKDIFAVGVKNRKLSPN